MYVWRYIWINNIKMPLTKSNKMLYLAPGREHTPYVLDLRIEMVRCIRTNERTNVIYSS